MANEKSYTGKYLKEFLFATPVLTEQVAISAVISDMDTEIEKLESELFKYQNLKQGMMQVLLTGKIRLLSN
jgi:type I restriction enzyme S subunit